MRVALVGLLLALGSAWADGFVVSKMPLELPAAQAPVARVIEDGQRAVIHWDHGVETLLLDVVYHGSGPVAWLVPVPAPPTRDDVFLARRTVIESLFNITRPERRRQVRPVAEPENRALDWLVPWPDELHADEEALDIIGIEAESPLPPDGHVLAAAAVEQPVTVLERFGLDVYDIAVLDARSGPDLVAWLGREGFAPPVGLGPLADDYLQQGWRFVALRTTGEESAGDELRDLPALGLRFASEQAIFPLTISRASAPQRTVLDLMVVHDHPVHCTTLAEAPTEELAGEGVTLDQRRREVMAAHGHAALVRDGYRRLWTSDQPPGEGQPALALDGRATSRFWSLLDRDAMVDLVFEPSRDDAANRSFAFDTATTHARLPLWQGLARQPWPPLLAAWLTAALLIHLWRRPDETRREGRPRRGTAWAASLREATAGLLVGVTLLAVAWIPLHTPAALALGAVRMAMISNRHNTDLTALAAGGGLLLALAPLAALLRARDPMGRDKGIRDAVGLFAISTAALLAVAAAAAPVPHDDTALSLNRLGGLFGWALVAAAVAMAPSERVRRQAAAVYGGVAVGFMLAAAPVPLLEPADEVASQSLYEERRDALVRKVARFGKDVGCLPARLSDITSVAPPAAGVDRSGNRVPIDPARWVGPYLGELPIDPTTGRRDTWRYEPTGEMIVDGGRWDELSVRVQRRRPEEEE